MTTRDTVAERLRRSTRNRLGSSRVGSSPAGVASFDSIHFSKNRMASRMASFLHESNILFDAEPLPGTLYT